MAATLYTARNLTRAARPVVLTIGRASVRPGRLWAPWRALTAWYVRRFRTWAACPLSTAQMLALHAVRHDIAAYRRELRVVLQAVFPRRWYQRVTGDPVRLILELFADIGTRELGNRVVESLVTTTTPDAPAAPLSPWEQLRAQQRREVYGDRGRKGGGVSLEVTALCTRAALGETWYWNPARWPTSDGYVPFSVCVLEYIGLQSLDARARLLMADGYALANARDPRAARRPFEQLAYPTET